MEQKKELKKELILDTHMRALEIMFRATLNANKAKRSIQHMRISIAHLKAAPVHTPQDRSVIQDKINLLTSLIGDYQTDLIECSKIKEAVMHMMHPCDQLSFHVCEN